MVYEVRYVGRTKEDRENAQRGVWDEGDREGIGEESQYCGGGGEKEWGTVGIPSRNGT